jgi:hypothetical protein
MRRNQKLESDLAEKIIGYVLVNTDDYFAAEKMIAQQTTNISNPKLPTLPECYRDIPLPCSHDYQEWFCNGVKACHDYICRQFRNHR